MTGRGPRKTRFDMTERARLRAALLRYMKEHGIGVPTLQVRIADGTDRSPDLLPLKTLQRFLADVGRTNDTFLIPCFEFAQSLPAGDDIEGFAREAAGFFGVEQAGANAAGLTGNYAVFARPQKTDTRMRVLAPDDIEQREEFSVFHSRCVVEQSGPAGPYRLHEETIITSEGTQADSVRHIYEGVVLAFDPLVFALSKNALTRLPRAYWLRGFADGTLAGYGMEAAFLTDLGEARPYTRPVDFEFRRESEKEQG